MTIEDMIQLWIEITGLDPQEDKKSWNISLGGKLSEWDIKRMNDKLMEVVKYDVNGIFTKIYLREYFNTFLKGKSVTYFDYLDEKEQLDKYFEDCQRLKLALSEVDESERLIIEETHQSIDFYGIKYEDIDIFNIVDLRISAEININDLNVVQFKRGRRSNDKIKYVRDVYMVNNIDMLIKSIENQSFDGISINYIYDPDEPACSYFVFLIKNGDNIFLMSDRPSYAHPNQKHMSRSKGRAMGNRINNAYFPYSLTNLDIDKYNVHDRNAEKVMADGYMKIGTISDMDYSEALWTINMFALIKQKFFTESYECPELSYAGGMVEHPMLVNNNSSLAKYDDFEKIALPFIEQPDKLELKYEYESLGIFKDTIERFKDKVDINAINAIGYSGLKILDDNHPLSTLNNNVEMLSLNVNDFGTRKELEYRQKWIVRYNFAKQINKFAREEYEEIKREVKEWYTDAVWKNISNVIDLVIFDKLKGDTIVTHRDLCIVTESVERIVQKLTIEDYLERGYWRGHSLNQSSGWGYECCFTGKKASIVICIFPNNINDIMHLTGCKEDEIPIVLKNWSPRQKGHIGNSILNNIDPCDWVIQDYWYKFIGQIDIMLSKSAYNDLYKKRGLAPDKFWLNKDNKINLS